MQPVVDGKENAGPSRKPRASIGGALGKKKNTRRRKSALDRRVSFSVKVDVRHFEKDRDQWRDNTPDGTPAVAPASSRRRSLPATQRGSLATASPVAPTLDEASRPVADQSQYEDVTLNAHELEGYLRTATGDESESAAEETGSPEVPGLEEMLAHFASEPEESDAESRRKSVDMDLTEDVTEVMAAVHAVQAQQGSAGPHGTGQYTLEAGSVSGSSGSSASHSGGSTGSSSSSSMSSRFDDAANQEDTLEQLEVLGQQHEDVVLPDMEVEERRQSSAMDLTLVFDHEPGQGADVDPSAILGVEESLTADIESLIHGRDALQRVGEACEQEGADATMDITDVLGGTVAAAYQQTQQQQRQQHQHQQPQEQQHRRRSSVGVGSRRDSIAMDLTETIYADEVDEPSSGSVVMPAEDGLAAFPPSSTPARDSIGSAISGADDGTGLLDRILSQSITPARSATTAGDDDTAQLLAAHRPEGRTVEGDFSTSASSSSSSSGTGTLSTGYAAQSDQDLFSMVGKLIGGPVPQSRSSSTATSESVVHEDGDAHDSDSMDESMSLDGDDDSEAFRPMEEPLAPAPGPSQAIRASASPAPAAADADAAGTIAPRRRSSSIHVQDVDGFGDIISRAQDAIKESKPEALAASHDLYALGSVGLAALPDGRVEGLRLPSLITPAFVFSTSRMMDTESTEKATAAMAAGMVGRPLRDGCISLRERIVSERAQLRSLQSSSSAARTAWLSRVHSGTAEEAATAKAELRTHVEQARATAEAQAWNLVTETVTATSTRVTDLLADVKRRTAELAAANDAASAAAEAEGSNTVAETAGSSDADGVSVPGPAASSIAESISSMTLIHGWQPAVVNSSEFAVDFLHSWLTQAPPVRVTFPFKAKRRRSGTPSFGVPTLTWDSASLKAENAFDESLFGCCVAVWKAALASTTKCEALSRVAGSGITSGDRVRFACAAIARRLAAATNFCVDLHDTARLCNLHGNESEPDAAKFVLECSGAGGKVVVECVVTDATAYPAGWECSGVTVLWGHGLEEAELFPQLEMAVRQLGQKDSGNVLADFASIVAEMVSTDRSAESTRRDSIAAVRGRKSKRRRSSICSTTARKSRLLSMGGMTPRTLRIAQEIARH